MNNDLIMSNDLIKELKLKLSKNDTDILYHSFPFLHESINHQGTKIKSLAQMLMKTGVGLTGEVSLSMLKVLV